MVDDHRSTHVLIIGAGPTGLTLGHELLRQGVQVRLIDKEPAASPNAKALGVWTRTLELFARTGTGIAEEMLERGVKTPVFNVMSEGKRLARLDFAHHIDASYRFILMIPQTHTEALLAKHVQDLGGSVERGTELIGLTQREGGVEVVLRHADGQEERTRTDWLVGCDGARSTVRHLLGASFVGKTFEQSFATGNVRVRWDAPPEEAHAFLCRGDLIAFFPLPDAGWYRVVLAHRRDEVPAGDVTLEEIQQAISAYGPAGARALELREATRFLVNQRKVETYVFRRVILAGDAAHIHTFVGAQGMNTGMQDAFNLAWKLALVAKGQAGVQLLESYEQERERVSERLLRATELGTRFALLRHPVLRGARGLLAPRISALPRVQRRIVNTLAELTISYRHSSIVSDDQDLRAGGRSRLRAGDRAPDGAILVGVERAPHRLFEVLSSTRHTLMIFSRPDEGVTKILALTLAELQGLVESYQIVREGSSNGEQEGVGKRLYDPAGALANQYGLANGGLVMIRPDGYIGFRSRQIGGESLHRYLRRLFVK